MPAVPLLLPARALLLLQATILAVFGGTFLLHPEAAAHQAGILLMDSAAVGFARAWLGILPLLAAAALALTWRNAGRTAPLLLWVASAALLLTLGRLLAGFAEGPPQGLDLALLGWWLTSAALAGWLRYALWSRTRGHRRHPLRRATLAEPPEPFRRGDEMSGVVTSGVETQAIETPGREWTSNPMPSSEPPGAATGERS